MRHRVATSLGQGRRHYRSLSSHALFSLTPNIVGVKWLGFGILSARSPFMHPRSADNHPF
jgi:hypothetical protein